MTKQEEIDALEKEISNLHLRVGGVNIRKHYLSRFNFYVPQFLQMQE